MKTLNKNQQAAVDSTAKRILVVAGPGSGKTETLVQRINRMCSDGADPASIICITFTNNAAHEMQKRLDWCDHCQGTGWILLGGAPPERDACPRCDGGCRLGFIGTLHGFMLRLLQQHGQHIGLASKLTVIDQPDADAILERVVQLLNYKGTRKDLEAAVALGINYYRSSPMVPGHKPEYRVAYEFYFQLMTSGAITFDSILELGLALIKASPQMRLNLQRYQHILVDEVQDSSRIDFDIYEALPVSTRFMVGDFDQAIYSFRGGDVGMIMQESRNPATTVIELFENYRSGSSICDAANRLISHNRNRLPKQCVPMRDDITSSVQFCTYERGLIEANEICAYIASHIQQGTPASECAILCRTNKLAAAFKAMLIELGVPVQAKTQVQQPPDWALARAFVALLTNPENDLIACKFLTLKFDAGRAQEMLSAAQNDFQTVNAQWLHIRNMQLADVTTVMTQAGIGRESVQAVRLCVEQLQPHATLLELQFALAQADAGLSEQTPGVFVGTIHSAKGKEFDVVMLPAIEEDLFPGRDDVEEARRLLFVGVTRARKCLTVSCAKMRTKEWSGLVETKPSKFFTEISCVV